jgi:ribosomal protein S18 acetylase RimI-like enzyme
MAAELRDVPAAVPAPEGLSIHRVRTAAELLDFASVNAANWDPPDQAVVKFFGQAAPLLLVEDCPMRLFVGYMDGQAVAASELFLGGGVAGIHMVSTRRAYQRRGIGLAMTWAAVDEGRRLGETTVALQASEQGRGVYARLGFQACCEFTEYQ